MKYLLVVFLLGILTYGHAQSCCAVSKPASVAIGVGSEGLVLERGSFSFQNAGTNWGLNPLETYVLQGTSIVDIDRVGIVQSNLMYGLGSKLSIGLNLNWINVSSSLHMFDGDHYLSNPQEFSGLGDLAVIGVYELPRKRSQFPKVAGTLGLELPSGDQRMITSSISSSMGSGSFDPIMGIALRKKFQRFDLGLNSTYKFTTENSVGMDQGDSWMSNLNILIPLQSKSDSISKPVEWLAQAQSSFSWLDQMSDATGMVVNTGAFRSFLGGGVVVSVRRTVRVFLGADLPVYEKVRGDQNLSKFQIKTSLTILLKKK